jgi:hypothetical protein
MKREKALMGIFSLHISKSGGSSLCSLFKNEGCFTDTVHPNSNCLYPVGSKTSLDFGPKWVRPKAERFNMHLYEDFDFKRFLVLDPENSDYTCDDVRTHMHLSKQHLAMSERWLPASGVCQNDFMNVIMIRNPMDRINSHYNHILLMCRMVNKDNTGLCESMFLNQPNGTSPIFNETIMMEYFDIASDNYITRTLSTLQGYQAPFGHMEAYIQSALENLNRFDWVLLLNQSESSNYLIENGMGLSSKFPHENIRSNVISLSNNGMKILHDLNQFDHQIWLEAQRLHELDLQSLQYMQMYGHDLLQLRDQSQEGDSCCGYICDSYFNNSV